MKRSRAINENRPPYALWLLIAFILVFGLLRRNVFIIVQLGLLVSAASWAWRQLRYLLLPAAKSARAVSGVEPKTKAELQAWLFRHTHERPPSSEQPLEFYRELYLKHRLSNVPAERDGAGAATAAEQRAYVDGRGAVFHATPLPPLTARQIGFMLFVGCTLGGLATSLCAYLPPPHLPDWLLHLLFRFLPPALLQPLYALDSNILRNSIRWLPRAVGIALAASTAGRVARPHSRSNLWAVLGWAMVASLVVEIHLPRIWFQLLAPAIFLSLGFVGEWIVLSGKTMPILYLLMPAAAACVGVARHARPTSSSSSASTVRQRRSSAGPLLLLLLLHLALMAGWVAQHPARRAKAYNTAEQLRRGDWRGVLHEARSHLHYEWTRYSRPPPPPLSPLSPEEAEKKACKALDVAVGAGWSEIKKAYRHKALEFHPDKLRAKLQREPNEEEVAEAARQFNEVQEAHDALERIHAERVEAGNLREEL